MENILNLLLKRSYSYEELLKISNLGSDDLTNILDHLVRDFLVIYNKKDNKYYHISNTNYKVGTMLVLGDRKMVNVDSTYYEVDDPTITIKNGEEVLIKVEDNKAIIFDIKVRNKTITGEVVLENDSLKVIPDSDEYRIRCNTEGLLEGEKVLIELEESIGKNFYEAKVVEILGHKDDPNIDTISVLRRNKVEVEFPESIEKELEEIPDSIEGYDISKRVDLRDEITFTIDGEHTKDFDDAISIKKVGDNYNLKVFIADVSEYAPYGSNLFKCAMNRGTSIYPPGCVVPMLPRKLSNGICSLNPNVDRLVLTFDSIIDKNGNVLSFNIYESVINSNMRMVYKDVNELFRTEKPVGEYKDYADQLFMSKELFEKIRSRKIKKGYLDFEMPETEIEIVNGNVIDVGLRTRGVSEKLIEDFMVLTNENSSMWMDGRLIDHIYRNHDVPDFMKIENLIEFLEQMNVDCSGLNLNYPVGIQKLLKRIRNRQDYCVLARKVLTSMKKAMYDIENREHFALISESMGHFTSPIRRSPDLCNHVLIKNNLRTGNVSLISKNEMSAIALSASSMERLGDKCEDIVNRMKWASYMSNFIDQEFDGIIVEMSKNGMTILLDNAIEGRVELKGEFKYSNYTLSNNNIKYTLGDIIQVKLIDVDVNSGKIVFSPISVKSKVKKR